MSQEGSNSFHRAAATLDANETCVDRNRQYVSRFGGHRTGAAVLPEDVVRFIERRDACDHFRGEEAYDARRREFLEQQTLKLCVGSDKQLAGLKKKYAGNKAVIARAKRL